MSFAPAEREREVRNELQKIHEELLAISDALRAQLNRRLRVETLIKRRAQLLAELRDANVPRRFDFLERDALKALDAYDREMSEAIAAVFAAAKFALAPE